MNDGAPFRARCDAYAGCTLGPNFQHARAAGQAVAQSQNTTAIAGAPVDGTTGKSTLQPLGGTSTAYCDSGATCESSPFITGLVNYNGSNYGATNVGGPWVNADNPNVPPNTFAPDSGAGTVNLSPCNQMGWQCVYATRQWQGQFGWLTPDGCTSIICTGGGTYSPYVSSPDQTKYLDCAWSMSLSASGKTGYGGSASVNNSSSINQQSGIITASVAISDPNNLNNDYNFLGAFSSIPYCTTDAAIVDPASSWLMFTVLTGYESETAYPSSTAYTQSTGGWTYTNTTTVPAGTLNGSITVTRTNTVYSWTVHWDWTVAAPYSGYASMDYSGSITLSNLNTAAAVIVDAESNLLSTWNLNDRLLYPLISTGWNGITVKVSRNEVQAASPLPFQLAAWTDPNAAFFDGSILGAPNLAAGYAPEDYFDFRHADYQDCGSCPDCNHWYFRGYGQWRSAAGATLPLCATQWTNPFEAYYGALAIGRNRLLNAGGIWVSKWAESGIRFPSYNHARPFGNDRLLPDETTVACINSFDGTTASLGNAVTIPDGSTVLFYGTSNDGIYTVNTGGGGTGVYSLTVTFVKALPGTFSYWDDGSGGAYNGIVAKLRFPTCPPMGGRLAVASVTDNHDGTCTLVTDAAQVPLDANVDLCDGLMNALASNLAPTASSTTTFNVTAAYATIAGAKWACLYGALPGEGGTPWYWGDSAGKGNFVLMEWVADKRTAGEAGRLGTTAATYTDCNGTVWDVPYNTGGQLYNPDGSPNYGYSFASFTDECKGFVACAPWMIVCSPNPSDTPPSGTGVRFDFGSLAPLDTQYGTQQSMVPSQAMADPLWQTPHASLCNPDATKPTCIPLVEARAILPAAGGATVPPDNGAGWAQNETPPPPPVDYTMLSPVTHNTGNVEYPPFLNCSSASQPACVATNVASGQFTGC